MNPADNQTNFNPIPVVPDDQQSSFLPPAQNTSFAPQTSASLPTTPPAPENVAPPETITQNPTPKSNKNKVLAAFVIVVMLLGIGGGVYAFRNYQAGSASAWDCALYTFNIDTNGTVTVQNGSNRNESAQKADVYINGTLVQTFDVPALNSGSGATLGTVSLPQNQSYTWRVDGTEDCEDSGSREVDTVNAECSAVVAYDENWTALTPTALSELEDGDIVRFTVSGTATSGTFDMARFSVNGATAVEVTDQKPGTSEFYYEYTIPAGEDTFNVTAEVHHSTLGWF